MLNNLKQTEIMNLSLISENFQKLKKFISKPSPFFEKSSIIKFMRIGLITLTVLIVTSFQLLVALPLKSQPLDQVEVKIGLKNATLVQAFQKIEEQSPFHFMYRDTEVKNIGNLNLVTQKKSVDEILKMILSNTSLTYKQVNNQILIIPDKNFINEADLKNTITLSEKPSRLIYTPVAHMVQGKVTNTNGEPLSGVSVTVKGSTTGTSTSVDGSYTIDVPATSTLLFSFIGYTSKSVPVLGRSEINVVLEVTVSELNQVVVIGYGTRTKANLTGAVSSVSGEELAKAPISNLSDAIAGKLSGVIANTRSGEPGADDAEIYIRGKGTLGNTSPLIVIDGVPDRQGGFSRLNPADIESFTVLKDATAAIYGARAANGVILITTKRGIVGKPVLSFTSNWSASQPTRVPKMLSSSEYAQSVNEYNNLIGQQPTYTAEDIQKYKDGSDPLAYPNTNWWSAVMKPWSLQQNQLLSLRGGSDKIKYFLSGQYLKQNTMYKGGFDYYKNQNATANIDIQATNNFKIGINVLYRNEFKINPGYGGLFSELWGAYPYLVPIYPNGKVGVGIGGGPNNSMYYVVHNDLGNDASNYDFLQTKTSFRWDLPKITKGLHLDGYYAYDLFYYQDKNFTKSPPPAYSYDKTTNSYDEVMATGTPALALQNDKTKDGLFNIKLA